MDFDEYLTSDEANLDADESLRDAVKQFNADSEPEPEPEPTEKSEPTPEPKPDAPKPEPTPEPVPAPEPFKQEQSYEERSRNAERRRQHEAAIAQRALESSVEYQMVQALASMSGRSPEQLYQDVYQAQISHEAQLRGQELPPEAVAVIAQERQAIAQVYSQMEQVQDELTQNQFEQWVGRIEAEKNQILGAYSYLTENDILEARDYMLTVLENPHVPLEQAVYAIHGAKMFKGQQEAMRTELLAELSGRKNSPLPPQGKAASAEGTLTADERYVARMLGISEQDYLKNK